MISSPDASCLALFEVPVDRSLASPSSRPPALIVLNPDGLALARRIHMTLPSAVIHALRSRVSGGEDLVFFDHTAAHIRSLFTSGRSVIAICASGIVIRALAPVLGEKTSDPPVLALSADGKSIVPLLGGHHGANALARQISDLTGGHAAITTAGDVTFGLALDCPPTGWRVGNPQDAKSVMASLLAGSTARIDVCEGLDPSLGDWLRDSTLPLSDDGPIRLRITDRDEPGDAQTLLYHPPVLAVGVGCERDTPAEILSDLVGTTLSAHELSPQAVGAVYSLDLKADEPAVHALARSLDVPARFFSAAKLEAQTPLLTAPSEVVFTEVGVHGVSEGAALAAVSEGGTLIVPKTKGQRSTCAIARAYQPLDPQVMGHAQGKLTIVGIGPGCETWRTPAVSEAIRKCTDLVGYGLYLDLLGPLTDGKARHQTNLGKEEDRARKALDLAAAGHDVCLVCSGDAGIFALATLVFDLLDHNKRPDWGRVDISVEPGVSAIQAAAARVGAPIGHDFCLLSLSDLLTPREVILKRLEALGHGDFVVGFYNPVSKRRRDLLVAARDILLRYRPAETPVVLARNLGRHEETINVTTLAQLSPELADMLTLVLVGNSETRRICHGGKDVVYTPRGYGEKWRDAKA